MASLLRFLSIVLIVVHIEIVLLVRFVRMEEEFDIYRAHLIQAGEWTFSCTGRSVEFKWKYHYPGFIKTVWSKVKSDGTTVNLASFQDGKFTLDPGANSVGLSGKLGNSGCCGLTLKDIVMEDAGSYSIAVTTEDKDLAKKVNTGVTNLHVYDDCPDVSNPTLKIECETDDGSTKTTDFTYRDIASVSVDIPNSPTVLRRFFYREQQHKIVLQPIRARCYNRDECDVVKWTLAKKSLSLAFFSKTPHLNLTLFSRIYHKRVLLDFRHLVFRLVDPESAEGKEIKRCKEQEPLPSGIRRWKPSTWNVLLLTSMAFAASNSIHRII